MLPLGLIAAPGNVLDAVIPLLSGTVELLLK